MALLPVSEALASILDGAVRIGVEFVPVSEAAGRILAQDVAAHLTQPPFNSASMDGYALRAADLQDFEGLEVIGEAAAGRSFSGSVARGQAVRIFTGAPVPGGADTVVIQEIVERTGSAIRVKQAVTAGANIRVAGIDFREGDVLLRAGRRLTARDLMLAAGMNHGELPVAKKPLVAILATGDELVAPGETPAADQIVSSSPAGLAAMVAQSGGEPWLLPIARDNLDSLTQRLHDSRRADILVTIGGASVGDHDLVGRALADAGASLHFHKVAMRPGKPLMSARMGQTRVIGVAGNPVATLICARVFLQPLIRRLTGVEAADHNVEKARLAKALAANGDRAHYMRGQLLRDGAVGGGYVRALDDQDSSLMAALASADCLIVRPPEATAAAVGDLVDILRLDF